MKCYERRRVREEDRIWHLTGCLISLGLAFSSALFSLAQSPSIYLLVTVVKRRCLKMIRVK